MANTKLSYPDVTTYIVIWGPEKKEFKGWAEAEPNQCFESKWTEVDYYTDRNEWKTVLSNNGVDPDEE